MSITARVRALWSMFGILVAMSAMSLAYSTTLRAQAADSGTRTAAPAATSNLKQILNALLTYQADNNAVLPPRLSMLYPKYIADPKVFWSAADSEGDPSPTTIDNDEPNQPNSAQISYAYLAGTECCESLPVVLLDNNGSDLYIGAGDGRVELYQKSDRWLPPSETARQHLKQIGTALLLYANDNSGKFPANLSTLYPSRISDSTVFWNPGDNQPAPTAIVGDVPNGLNSAQVSFRYLGAAYDTSCRAATILALDGSLSNNGGSGINVLTADGAVAYYAPVPPACTPPAPSVYAQFNLREIGLALATYAMGYDNKLPPSLSVLYPDYLPRPTSFWHPCDSDLWPLTIDNDSLNQPNSAQISFVYFHAGADLDTLQPDDVIVRDNTPMNNGGDGNLTLYADWHVEYVTHNLIGIEITGPATVSEAGTATFHCIAKYDDDFTKEVTAGWSLTSGPGSMAVDGTYTAPGSVLLNTPVTLSATYMSLEAHIDFVVLNSIRHLAGVAISTTPETVAENSTQTYTCTASFDDGSSADVTASSIWSMITGPGSFSNPGTYAAPASVTADTSAKFSASYTENGATQQATKTITVKNTIRKVTTLTINSGPDNVPENSNALYTCLAMFDDSTTADVTASATWSATSGPGSFPSPGTFAAPATVLANSTATIKASYTEGGNTRDATKNITVQNTVRKLIAVAITAGPAEVAEGATGQYACTATYDDATTQVVTNAATWSVSAGPGTISGTGQYTAPSSVAASINATIGVSYTEGGITKQAARIILVKDVPMPVADADKDGVPDSSDACPGTPAGATVDAKGCAASQRDTDGDGVFDSADTCPGTASGTHVNSSGCPDQDRDGVADAVDNCPAVVNAGQQDTDHDGTGNACDLCPDDPNKTAPGNCGCGQAETANCSQATTYTVRVSTASGESVPYTYAAGESVDITAPAAPDGMRFSYWSGDISSTENPVHVYVDRNLELVANYEDCPIEQPPCGPGVPVCAAAAMLGLTVTRLWRRV